MYEKIVQMKGWVQIVPTLDIPTKGNKQMINCAKNGGKVAGRTRRDIESHTKKGIIEKGSFLPKVDKLS